MFWQQNFLLPNFICVDLILARCHTGVLYLRGRLNGPQKKNHDFLQVLYAKRCSDLMFSVCCSIF